MYKSYWKLSSKPFENTPDPRFFYLSNQHKEMFSRFSYVIEQRKQMAMFSGEYGAGKTLINMVILSKFKGSLDYKISLIINPRLELIDFLKEILYQFKKEVPPTASKFDILHTLREAILENPQLKKVVIIDEAQMIEDINVFEELRLLSNLTYEDQFLTTIIFVGQPQLKKKIYQIPQLRQRLALTHHLNHLSSDETRGYIQHRLEVAGAEAKIFSDGAAEVIFNATGGVPRLINTMCDICLAIGKSKEVSLIDKDIVEKVSLEIMGEING